MLGTEDVEYIYRSLHCSPPVIPSSWREELLERISVIHSAYTWVIVVSCVGFIVCACVSLLHPPLCLQPLKLSVLSGV